MKSPIKIITTMLVFMFVITSCSSDDGSNSNDNTISETENLVQNGAWNITYFFDTDSEETSDFNGYSFRFNENGSLEATNGSNTVTGSWSILDDSSSSDDDGSSSSNYDFNIFFPVPDSSDFEDLNDDWDIVSVTATKIELMDVSGGNGGTDFLNFEKN